MNTPFKHLSYLLLSGMLVTAVACGNDSTTDEAATAGDTMAMANDMAPAAPMPADTMNAGAAMNASPDQDFATKASAGNLAEINAHQAALDRAITADVKKHAQMMLTDHKKMDADMKALAAKKGLTLASAPREDKAKMLADMNATKQGKDWDAGYVDAQIQDHKETIALFEDGERNVQDAELKTLITTTLPKLRAHLKMVEDAKSKMK